MGFVRVFLGAAISMIVASPLCAEVAPAPVFDVPQVGVAFATGDTWTQNGQTMRLYGVQSCIRGTTFTNPLGVKTDCGEASLAYLAALVHDTRPQCAPVAQIGEQVYTLDARMPSRAMAGMTTPPMQMHGTIKLSLETVPD